MLIDLVLNISFFLLGFPSMSFWSDFPSMTLWSSEVTKLWDITHLVVQIRIDRFLKCEFFAFSCQMQRINIQFYKNVSIVLLISIRGMLLYPRNCMACFCVKVNDEQFVLYGRSMVTFWSCCILVLPSPHCLNLLFWCSKAPEGVGKDKGR